MAKKNYREPVTHEFPAVFDRESRVLLLGSIPSPKSREVGFYYGHPQNRFWKVIAAVLGEDVPATIPQKKAMLKKHHVALWDVLESCTIVGASDTSIEDVQIKLQYDMYYYENMSLLLDFQILVRTVYVVLTGKGAQ